MTFNATADLETLGFRERKGDPRGLFESGSAMVNESGESDGSLHDGVLHD